MSQINIKLGQRILGSFAASLGTVPLTGELTPATLKLVADILSMGVEDWQEKFTSPERRFVAAVQYVLTRQKYEPGVIDGFHGHLTDDAMNAWNHFITTGKHFKLSQKPIWQSGHPARTQWPSQKDCKTFYGTPGPKVVAQLVKIELPFKMRLAWDLDTTISTMTLHEKCSESALRVLKATLKEYGESRLDELQLNRFGGSYNHRKMRGSKDSWSMHAYGCAIDFDPDSNGLQTKAPKATLSAPVYDRFFNLWESEGWVSLGRAINRDWMHVQAARL